MNLLRMLFFIGKMEIIWLISMVLLSLILAMIGSMIYHFSFKIFNFMSKILFHRLFTKEDSK